MKRDMTRRNKLLSMWGILIGIILLVSANFAFQTRACSCPVIVVQPGEPAPPSDYCCINYAAIIASAVALLLIALGVIFYLYLWQRG